MSLLSDNIIPGNYGKVFGTNAKHKKDLKRIRKNILSLKGVKEVVINTEIFPREFTVYTIDMIKVEDIEKKVQATGFHAISKDLFKL